MTGSCPQASCSCMDRPLAFRHTLPLPEGAAAVGSLRGKAGEGECTCSTMAGPNAGASTSISCMSALCWGFSGRSLQATTSQLLSPDSGVSPRRTCRHAMGGRMCHGHQARAGSHTKAGKTRPHHGEVAEREQRLVLCNLILSSSCNARNAGSAGGCGLPLLAPVPQRGPGPGRPT